MPKVTFAEVVDQIRTEDSRFDKEAYVFLRQGLDHTLKALKDVPERTSNHVTGQELLIGIREYALEQYGPMTLCLLNNWGVTCCEDFGEMVFQLVEAGVLGKTDTDCREDFGTGYHFNEAFLAPFQPADKLITS